MTLERFADPGVPDERVKFAQVMRVLLAKCMVIERLPRKERSPSRTEMNDPLYDCFQEVLLMEPYLPERSPT